MTWTTEFISRCLDGLPKDKYRQRAQAELTDHLLELADELEVSGYSPEEAQKRALELMGNPVELNPSFRESWVRMASNWKYCLGTVVKSALHGLLFGTIIRWALLMPVTYLGKGILFDWLESRAFFPCFLFSLVEFLPCFWFISQQLHECFAIHPRRRMLVILGVGATWVIDVGPFLLILLGLGHLMGGMFGLSFSVLLGHSALYLMMLGAGWHFQVIIFCSFVICLFFALIFHPPQEHPLSALHAGR